MFLDTRTDRALQVNPSAGLDHKISLGGDKWLWTVAAVYLFSFFIVFLLSFIPPKGEKIFHYLFTISLFTGTLAYFTAASNLGWIPVVTCNDAPGTRQIYYSKYINWFVGWTPLVTAIGLLSGVSWATIIYNVGLMWAWIASWLAGAVVATRYKWGYFAFGCFAYAMLAISLLAHGGATAKRLSMKGSYTVVSLALVAIWLAYPIAWGLDDGGNQAHVTRTWIFWGILDCFTGPFFAFGVLALISSKNFDWDGLGLRFTSGDRPPTEIRSSYHHGNEKVHENGVPV